MREALERLDAALQGDSGYALAWAARAECYLYLVSDGINVLRRARAAAGARGGAAGPAARRPALRGARVLGTSTSRAGSGRTSRPRSCAPWSSPRATPTPTEVHPVPHRPGAARRGLAAIKKARKLDPSPSPCASASPPTASSPATMTRRPRAPRRSSPSSRSTGSATSCSAPSAASRSATRRRTPCCARPWTWPAHPPGAREPRPQLRPRRPAGRGAPDPRRARGGVGERLHAPHRPGPSALALGEADRALDWLERAVEVRDQALLLARVNTHYRPLHGHPRFQRVLEQVGLG